MMNKKYYGFVFMMALLGVFSIVNTLSFENFNLESILGGANVVLILITLVFSMKSKSPLENDFTRFFVVFTIGVNIFFGIYISLLKETQIRSIVIGYLFIMAGYYTYLIKQKKSS